MNLDDAARIIADKNAEIFIIEESYIAAERLYREIIAAKNEEIERWKNQTMDARQLAIDEATTIRGLRAEIAALRATLKLYETAIDEAEAIFGVEYGDAFGPMFEIAMAARKARAAVEMSRGVSEDEMRKGFAQGRRLIQKDWSRPEEIKAVDAMLAEGVCRLEDGWRFHDNFQCERRIVVGVPR